MRDVVIVSAVRTPIGRFNGSLSTVASYSLGAAVIEEVIKRASVEKESVSDVILGQVLQAVQGQNPARHASLLAGLPYTVPAITINQVCGSGLRAIAMGFQSIANGDGDNEIIVAGGQENMSMAPHCAHIRKGLFGNLNLIDTALEDGLTDAFHKCKMGETAENIAFKYKIPRKDQDEFATKSQMKAKRAIDEDKFKDEILPIVVPKGAKGGGDLTIDRDEFPRPSTTVEGLSRLRVAFTEGRDPIQCSVTAGNSTGMNDGAAAVLLMSADEAKRRHLPEIGRIVSWAQAGVDPLIMGTGPVPAVLTALLKAKWKIEEVDLFEINEAFAAQSIAVINQLNIEPKKVNVNGGAIALGHPLGASGARILVTLLHAMRQRDVKRGVAALCVGGGMGVAMCVECR